MSKGLHPKHPPCPGCGRALYKSAVVGKQVKKTDPWAFCRGKKCDRYGQDQTKFKTTDDLHAALAKTPVPEPTPTLPKEAPEATCEHSCPELAQDGRCTLDGLLSTQEAPKPVEPEHPSIAKARERIRGLVEQAAGDTAPNIVGLTLALVSQETGNHAAANALIDEYSLEALGISKVSTQDKK